MLRYILLSCFVFSCLTFVLVKVLFSMIILNILYVILTVIIYVRRYC